MSMTLSPTSTRLLPPPPASGAAGRPPNEMKGRKNRCPSSKGAVRSQGGRSPNLDGEPYWHELTRLIDWACTNTLSAYWSCLAAHAAVLHLDGVSRRRLPVKCSGVYSCKVQGDYLEAFPAELVNCHSRLND